MTDKTLKTILIIWVPILVWIPYLIYVYKFSSGLPFNDDYDMFLGSLINFENAHGLENKLTVLFAQHMEHRPAFPRLVAWLLVKTTGNCNFKVLILIGNLMLMATTLFISLANNKLKWLQSILLNIAFILIVCGIQSKENIFWATGSVQNYSVIFFATAAIYSATKNKYTLSILLGTLGVCCSMSGFIIAPVIILIALYNKKITSSVVCLIVFALVAILYSMHYKQPDLSSIPGVILQKELIVKIKYFFAFLGSFASIKTISVQQSLIAGTMLFSLTILLNLNYKTWDFWTFLSFFILVNALAGVNSRSELGVMQALSERYKIISEILFICNMVKLFNYKFKYKTWAIAAFLILSTGVFYAQYKYYQSFVIYNKETTKLGVVVFLLQQNPMLLKYPIPAAAAERLIKCEQMHIYKINFDD